MSIQQLKRQVMYVRNVHLIEPGTSPLFIMIGDTSTLFVIKYE